MACGTRAGTHAAVAGFVAAVWFEFVYFAPHTLGEPLATAVILPAALLLTRASPSQRDLVGGGALLTLAVLFRFQYAPAIATLAIGACWPHRSRIWPVMAGGIGRERGRRCGAWRDSLQLAGREHRAEPAARSRRRIRRDAGRRLPRLLLVDVVDRLVPLSFAVFRGWRHALLLLSAALVNIAFHSLIGHKEYRFIFLSVVLLVIVASLGSVDWMLALRNRPSSRRFAGPLMIGGWISVSAVLATTGSMPEYWNRGIGANKLASALRADSEMCGLALYDTPFFLLPGKDRLAGHAPLFALYPTDPLTGGDQAATASTASPAFNRILAHRSAEKELPASFAPRECESVGGSEVCIFARGGGCVGDAAASFAINGVLARTGL